jgi:hypothetical protein
MKGDGQPGATQLEGAQSPSLTVEKSAPNEIQVGRPATFQLKIRNVGRAIKFSGHDAAAPMLPAPLLGGDTVRVPAGATTVAFTVTGIPHPGGPVLRSGGRPGDALVVITTSDALRTSSARPATSTTRLPRTFRSGPNSSSGRFGARATTNWTPGTRAAMSGTAAASVGGSGARIPRFGHAYPTVMLG